MVVVNVFASLKPRARYVVIGRISSKQPMQGITPWVALAAIEREQGLCCVYRRSILYIVRPMEVMERKALIQG
jgi:hypothetical protein